MYTDGLKFITLPKSLSFATMMGVLVLVESSSTLDLECGTGPSG
jgi:hypothetical protein